MLDVILRDAGYRNIRQTTDPRQAIRLYADERPDLLILDLQMPDMDGFGVMEEIRRSAGDGEYLPILAITSFDSHNRRLKALKCGARDFITRPFNRMEALARIRNILEANLLYAELAAQNRELNGMATQLRETSAELEAFGYSVAHDLRAPLRRVNGLSTLLAESLGKNLASEDRATLESIQRQSIRMGEMIDDLLKLSKMTQRTPERRTTDLRALAEEIVAELRSRDPSRQVEFIASGNLTVLADTGLLRIALENLLGNAWKYTSRTQDARIEFVADACSKRALFHVRDNGDGFDMRNAQRLFSPFQRLHSTDDFPGTGIGLSIVKRIIRQHGGRIWATAEPGRGATFSFTLGVSECAVARENCLACQAVAKHDSGAIANSNLDLSRHGEAGRRA